MSDNATQTRDRSVVYRTGLGVVMFIIYGCIYVGFVCINIFAPNLMEVKVLFGMNLAVVYGFMLIVAALVFALIYNWKCMATKDTCDETGGE